MKIMVQAMLVCAQYWIKYGSINSVLSRKWPKSITLITDFGCKMQTLSNNSRLWRLCQTFFMGKQIVAFVLNFVV